MLAAQHLSGALSALDEDAGPDATALRARILTDRGLVAHRQDADDDAATLATQALAGCTTWRSRSPPPTTSLRRTPPPGPWSGRCRSPRPPSSAPRCSGHRHRQAALHNNLADLLRASGRNDDAMVHLKQAVTLFADIDEQEAPQVEVWKLAEW